MDTDTPVDAVDSIALGVSMKGFFATMPELTYSEEGRAVFFARFGIECHRTAPDGTRIRLEPRFGSVFAYGETAEIAHRQFRKYDVFIAHGQIETNKNSGKQQFVAEDFGHSILRTRYEVDRSPRHTVGESQRQAITPDSLNRSRRRREQPQPTGISR
jgi:single-stranded DNA-binding protein